MSQQVKKSKGWKTAKMTERQSSWEEQKVSTPFFDQGCDVNVVNDFRGAMVSDQNEHGAAVVHHALARPGDLGALGIRVFSCFIIAGPVPAMSRFF